MAQININDIIVGERFRKTFEGMDELAQSIMEHGLILPIIIDEKNLLVDGERRLRACKMAKLEVVEVRYLGELSELERKELELEANLHRKDFTWTEEVTAKAQLHAIKQKTHGRAVPGHETEGAWGLKDTASILGENPATVSIDLQLARGIKAFPELLKEKNKNQAYKKLRQMQENLLQEELAKRMKIAGILDNPLITCGNCIEEMKKLPAESVDFILTDPPYGVEIGDSQTFGRQQGTDVRFEDGEFETFNLLDMAIPEMYRILRNDRHLVMFCAIDKFQKVRELLVKHGFWVHHIPLIWDKGSGGYPSQSTTFTHSYEPIIHAMKGKRKINGTPRDVFQVKRVPSEKKIHPTEKPTELLRDLIKLLSLTGESIYDPFAGSGSTLEAARETSRQASGVEMDPVRHENIIKRLAKKEEVKDA